MPTSFETLAQTVAVLAADVARCEVSCTGIYHDRRTGVLPRCLLLEAGELDGDLANGTIVIGLNPGPMQEAERTNINEILKSLADDADGLSAAAWQVFVARYYTWIRNAIAASVPYYTLIRSLVRSSGRAGPILWTEVLKCETHKPLDENTKKRGLYKGNPETVKQCTTRFLARELSVAPADWPVVAAGRDAFAWASANVRNRCVVGVPHPSGRSTFDFVSVFPPTLLDTRRLVWMNGSWHSAQGQSGVVPESVGCGTTGRVRECPHRRGT